MSRIKEILCLHHSHLDVGYTHPQEMLLELQCDYIEQAIDLCLQTQDWPEESRFRWTCEATLPLVKWMRTARKERIREFRRLVKDGYISVAALPMHTTPDCTTMQLTQYLQHLDEIRDMTGTEIRTAINHDINGQPWTLSSLLLDSKIEFYITGINIHFGGIPFPRPYVFQWVAPDGRKLPSFVGEHYSLFSQFFYTYEDSTEKMHQGVQEYVERIEKSGWKEDFVYLTATNPPLFDNNSPDENLADLIRRYNAENHEQTIRFITPEMLYDRVKMIGLQNLDLHAGDWTDYWNFGCASTAREVKINRKAKSLLMKSDFLDFANPVYDPRLDQITETAYDSALLFDEHTWGASESVDESDQEETYAQLNHKKDYAYKAADLSAYLVSKRIEKYAQNPLQADKQEGVLVVNPTGVHVQHNLEVPAYMTEKGRTLAALRAKEFLPYEKNKKEIKNYGLVKVNPFSAVYFPFQTLSEIDDKKANNCHINRTEIDTPFYKVFMNEKNGRIWQIYDKKSGHKLIQEDAKWGLFDIVEENIDKRFAASDRASIFSRDIEKGNKSITQWQHDWRATHEGIREFSDFRIEESSESITLCYYSSSKSLKNIEQKIKFSTIRTTIELDITFTKDPVEEPEGIYLTFPLNLHKDWQCIYDTADTFVKLDEEQLGNVCRDFLSVDKTVSLFDNEWGYTLACPDAPMVQVGGFNFGRENKKIARNENPLLLAWPMNNYWNTNFAISQEGKESFHYELNVFERFNKIETFERGIQATKPCIMGAAICCEKPETKELVNFKSATSVPLFIRPQYKKEGWMIAVKNLSSNEGICRLTIPGKTMKSVSLTDAQGNVREELEIKDNGVTVTQTANSIIFLKCII